MEESIPTEVREKLLRLVRWRIECIRSGDRAGLDATYCPSCLGRRNERNQHDYRWYMSMIEDGFGEETQKIDLVPLVDDETFPGLFLALADMPEFQYKAFVKTTSGRRTMWMIDEFKGEFCVVLPHFSGGTIDRLTTGEWRAFGPEDQRPAHTTYEFDPRSFVKAISREVAQALQSWRFQLKFETLRAAKLSCIPWRGSCLLQLLTTQEDFDEARYGKWVSSEWRWGELAEVARYSLRTIQIYYQGETETDKDLSTAERGEVIFRCLAEALQGEEVEEAFARFYKRTEDFELGVFHPDRSKINYCKPKPS